MPVRVRIDSIARITDVEVRAAAIPEQQRIIAKEIGAEIEEAKATNARILGRVPPYTITVDGVQGAPLESVNPDGGSIILEFELVSGVLQWIAETLVERSPSVSGDYKRAHTLYADGNEVPLGGEAPSASEYVFLNPVPYSRKLELGKTKAGRDFLVSVPNRIYERTADDAKRRFGNQARISFSYRAPFAGAFFQKTSSNGGNSRERDLRVPAIIVNMGRN